MAPLVRLKEASTLPSAEIAFNPPWEAQPIAINVITQDANRPPMPDADQRLGDALLYPLPETVHNDETMLAAPLTG